MSKSDLVIEAIIESIKVKRDLFKHLDEHARYVRCLPVRHRE